MRYMILWVGMALIGYSCSKSNLTGEVSSGLSNTALAATSYLDVSYGSDNHQTMDVYLPAERTNKTRLLLIIHGGGWTAGDKSDFSSYVTEFQKRLPEYAFANLNYRLSTTNSSLLADQENDVQTAVKFLKNKAGDYSISNDFVFLGISAGAQLALLQGYKHGDVLQPKGIISFFGPVDLQQLYVHSDSTIPWVLKTILGTTLQENPAIFAQFSPINFVSSGSAPTLMLHGDADNLVPIEQAYMLRDKLSSLNVNNRLVVYPGQGHGWVGDDLTDSFDKVEQFIKGL